MQELTTPPYIVVLLCGLFMGICLIIISYSRLRVAYLTFSTKNKELEELSAGLVGISGEVSRVKNEKIQTPFTGEEAVIADWRVEEYSTDGEWTEKLSGTTTVPFYVSDGETEVLVDFGENIEPDKERYTVTSDDAGGFNCSFQGREEKQHISVDDDTPDEIKEFVAEQDGIDEQEETTRNLLGGGRKYGDRIYFEEGVNEGDDVYILGFYHPFDEVINAPSNGTLLISDKPIWKLILRRVIIGIGSGVIGLSILAVVLLTVVSQYL